MTSKGMTKKRMDKKEIETMHKTIATLGESGTPRHAIADELNRMGFVTARGGKWSGALVSRYGLTRGLFERRVKKYKKGKTRRKQTVQPKGNKSLSDMIAEVAVSDMRDTTRNHVIRLLAERG